MSEDRPALLVLDDIDDRRSALVADLARRFDRDYEAIGVAAASAATTMARLAAEGRSLAAVLSAAELGGVPDGGVHLLADVRGQFPTTKRILLVERGQWTGHPVRHAMALGHVEGYLFVPWQPKEQWLYLPMAEYLADWSQTQPPEAAAFVVVGEQWHARSAHIRDALSRAVIPYRFVGAQSAEGAELLAEHGVDGGADTDLPLLLHYDRSVLVNPSDLELAQVLGFPAVTGTRYDVAIVGGGPAGLSAAVYAASEGLRVCVIDPTVPGGQAGSSSMIRNYLGFPRGISGMDLTTRAVEQAWLFGTDFLLAQEVVGLQTEGEVHQLVTSASPPIEARSVVLACGVSWRRLGVPSLEALVGAGVFYGAAASEADALADCEVFVVGGGNSAGQAALHLAKRAARVNIVIRRNSLADSMSDYLIRQIRTGTNLGVVTDSEVVAGSGGGRLQELVLHDTRAATSRRVRADALFVMIGGEPRTGWLPRSIARDTAGYLLTGVDADESGSWPLARSPLFAETSRPGVFAVGDVVSGSSKRVAPSVGSGAVAIQMVHRYLAD